MWRPLPKFTVIRQYQISSRCVAPEGPWLEQGSESCPPDARPSVLAKSTISLSRRKVMVSIMHNDRVVASPAYARNRRPLGRYRGNCRYHRGYLPRLLSNLDGETLGGSINTASQPASRGFGGHTRRGTADSRDTCEYLRRPFSQKQKTPPPGQLYPAAWPVRNGLVNGTAWPPIRNRYIDCPQRRLAAQRTSDFFVSDGVARSAAPR
ncbi:hypothetical protein ACQKWADRAFT_292110 [Trichoderma austrokoningii]